MQCGKWTHAVGHSRQMLYHYATSPTLLVFFSLFKTESNVAKVGLQFEM